MTEQISFEALAKDILSVVHKHGLTADTFSLVIRIPADEFEIIARTYPTHRSDLILITRGNDWSVQIHRSRELKDFPTGAILNPPPEE